MERLYIIVGSTVVALLIAAAIVPLVIDWNGLKPWLAQKIEAGTNSKATIVGDIGVRLLPTPKLVITDLRLELKSLSVPLNTEDVFIERIDADLSLSALFNNRDQTITRLNINHPLLKTKKSVATDSHYWRQLPTVSTNLMRYLLATKTTVNITSGVIKSANNQAYIAKNIDMRIIPSDNADLLSLKSNLTIGDDEITIDAKATAVTGEFAKIAANINLASIPLSLTIGGELTDCCFSGKLTASLPKNNPGKTNTTINSIAKKYSPELLQILENAQITTDFVVNDSSLTTSNLQIALMGKQSTQNPLVSEPLIRFSGSLNAKLAAKSQFNLELQGNSTASNQLSYDHLKSLLTFITANLQDLDSTKAKPANNTATNTIKFVFPRLSLVGTSIRNTILELENSSANNWILTRLDTTIANSGFIKWSYGNTSGGRSGRLRAAIPAAVIKTLSPDLTALASDRNIIFDAIVSANAGNVLINPIKIKYNKTTVTGDYIASTKQRVLNLKFDRIKINKLIRFVTKPRHLAGASPLRLKITLDDPYYVTRNNGNINLGSISLDAIWHNGDVKLNSLVNQPNADSKITVSGIVNPTAVTGHVKFNIASTRPSSIVKSLMLLTSETAVASEHGYLSENFVFKHISPFTPFKLSGSIDRTDKTRHFTLKAKGTASTTNFAVSGKAANLQPQTANLDFTITNQSPVVLAQQFGLSWLDQRNQPTTLSGYFAKVSNDNTANGENYEFYLQTTPTADNIKLKLKNWRRNKSHWQGNLFLSSSNVDNFLPGFFAFNRADSKQTTTRLSMNAAVGNDYVRLTNIKGDYYGQALTGNLLLNLGDNDDPASNTDDKLPRPQLTGSLNFTEITPITISAIKRLWLGGDKNNSINYGKLIDNSILTTNINISSDNLILWPEPATVNTTFVWRSQPGFFAIDNLSASVGDRGKLSSAMVITKSKNNVSLNAYLVIKNFKLPEKSSFVSAIIPAVTGDNNSIAINVVSHGRDNHQLIANASGKLTATLDQGEINSVNPAIFNYTPSDLTLDNLLQAPDKLSDAFGFADFKFTNANINFFLHNGIINITKATFNSNVNDGLEVTATGSISKDKATDSNLTIDTNWQMITNKQKSGVVENNNTKSKRINWRLTGAIDKPKRVIDTMPFVEALLVEARDNGSDKANTEPLDNQIDYKRENHAPIAKKPRNPLNQPRNKAEKYPLPPMLPPNRPAPGTQSFRESQIIPVQIIPANGD